MKRIALVLLMLATFMACMTAVSFGEEASAEDEVMFAQGDHIALAIGKSETIKIQYPKSLKKAKKSLLWVSGDETVATVSEKGTVKAVGNGTTTIACKISFENGTAKTLSCKVDVYTPLTSGKLKQEDVTLGIGQTRQLIWSVEPQTASNPEFEWVSDDESIATVQDGRITGISAGKTVIKAAAIDGSGVTMKCRVNVTGLFLEKENFTIRDLGTTDITLHYTGILEERYLIEADENLIRYEIEKTEEEPEGNNTCIIHLKPMAVCETTLTIKDKTDKTNSAAASILVTEDGIPNAQKLVISQAEMIPNTGMVTYRMELTNNSSQEIGEISFLVDYRNQFRDTKTLSSEADGTIQLYRYTTMINILPGEKVTVAGRNNNFGNNMITEVRLAICYYRYVDSAEKIYIPDSQLYWYSTKNGEMERPVITADYEAPSVEVMDKAERIQLGAVNCEVYSYCSKDFARSYRPGKLITIVGENSYAAYWGLEYRDVIYGADGNLWENDPFFLERAFADIYDGKTVQLMVVRNGEEIQISARKKPKETPVPLMDSTPSPNSVGE